MLVAAALVLVFAPVAAFGEAVYGQKLNAQFRAEMFNAFHHANLGQPYSTVDSPTAGQIFALANLAQMRKWQLGLHLRF